MRRRKRLSAEHKAKISQSLRRSGAARTRALPGLGQNIPTRGATQIGQQLRGIETASKIVRNLALAAESPSKIARNKSLTAATLSRLTYGVDRNLDRLGKGSRAFDTSTQALKRGRALQRLRSLKQRYFSNVI
jgi:hypothetical protein